MENSGFRDLMGVLRGKAGSDDSMAMERKIDFLVALIIESHVSLSSRKPCARVIFSIFISGLQVVMYSFGVSVDSEEKEKGTEVEENIIMLE